MKKSILLLILAFTFLGSIGQQRISNKDVRKIEKRIKKNETQNKSPIFIVTLNPGECPNCLFQIRANFQHLIKKKYDFIIVTPVEDEKTSHWLIRDLLNFKIDTNSTIKIVNDLKLFKLLQKNNSKSRLFLLNKGIVADEVFFTLNPYKIDSIANVYFLSQEEEIDIPDFKERLPVNNYRILNNHLFAHNLISYSLFSIDLESKKMFNFNTKSDVIEKFIELFDKDQIKNLNQIELNIKNLDSVGIRSVSINAFNSNDKIASCIVRVAIPFDHIKKDSLLKTQVYITLNEKLDIKNIYKIPESLKSKFGEEYSIMYYGSPFSEPFLQKSDTLFLQVYRKDLLDGSTSNYTTTFNTAKFKIESNSLNFIEFSKTKIPNEFIDSKRFYDSNWLNYSLLEGELQIKYIDLSRLYSVNGMVNLEKYLPNKKVKKMKNVFFKVTDSGDIALVKKFDYKYYLLIFSSTSGKLKSKFELPNFSNPYWIIKDKYLYCISSPIISKNKIYKFRYRM